MHYIAEKHASAGNVQSSWNGRLYIDRKGNTTPALDEAMRLESESDAVAFAAQHGIEIGSHWIVVEDAE